MLERKDLKLLPDKQRVLLQFFYPGNEKRVKNIIDRVCQVHEEHAEKLLDKVIKDFSGRHRNFLKELENNYKLVEKFIPEGITVSSKQKLLIGSYFSKEYSIESASLFNPSIVLFDPVKATGEVSSNDNAKFVMSLRSTGEGHISSVSFRTGTISSDYQIKMDKSTRFVTSGQKASSSSSDLESFYEVKFDPSVPVSERVLFPLSKYESNGMEDARFVNFYNDDGTNTYYATYTGYDGRNIYIHLIETLDFTHFKINLLKGDAAKDKGMALFPRKINGSFTMISRQDGENLYIMQSPNIYEWNNMQLLKTPELSWEFVQIGNCGSPIETDQGWILLTHAVGPMRTYVISALLLDKDNPSKIIGYLTEPLISPNQEEREGYVPNVLYSCGSLVFKDMLLIPYAMSDSASGFSTIALKELLGKFIRL
ncbi:MAG: glycoside hydrolase family 130 protein [Clostridiales bacterium]